MLEKELLIKLVYMFTGELEVVLVLIDMLNMGL